MFFIIIIDIIIKIKCYLLWFYRYFWYSYQNKNVSCYVLIIISDIIIKIKISSECFYLIFYFIFHHYLHFYKKNPLLSIFSVFTFLKYLIYTFIIDYSYHQYKLEKLLSYLYTEQALSCRRSKQFFKPSLELLTSYQIKIWGKSVF